MIVDAVVLVVALSLLVGGLWLLWAVALEMWSEWRSDRDA